MRNLRGNNSALKCCIAIIILLGLSATASANVSPLDNRGKSLQKLRDIQTSIRSVEKQLRNDEGKLSHLQEKLRQIETNIAEREDILQTLRKRLKKTNALLTKVSDKIKTTEGLRQRQARHLTKQLETQYIMRQQSPLKLLLNQEDPLQVRRMFTYLGYINKARVKDITQYNETLTKLSTLKAEAQITLQQAHEIYAETQKEKLALAREYAQRSEIMKEIKASLQNNQTKLSGLKKDEQRLKELVAKIGDALNDIPAHLEQKFAFKSMRGKLPWPTKGKSNRQTNGIIIAAPAGQQVRTVHSGRVAYADWLRGFGLLIIVDHSDGYMTLYAHNRTIYKEIGDWVEPNEVIATVGKTGGAEKPGLYFEVRKNGRPINPLKWVNRRGRTFG